MALNLDQVLLHIPCPSCGYQLEVQVVDARTQVWRWCPCCRARVRLVEPDGSVSVGLTAANQVMRKLEATMGDLFR